MTNKDWTGNGNSIFKTLGASNHTDKERQSEDFYATSPIAIEKLAEVFPLNHQIWEPACGNGCLSKWMVDNGYDVVSTDLVDRGYGKGGVDFLKTAEKPFNGAFDIVTNPPYIRAKEFILHGLELIPEGGRVIMFLKTTFLEGKARKKEIYDITPPRWVYQFSERVLCAKNGDFDYMRKHGGSAVSYAWYVFNKHNNEKITQIKWL